MDRVNPKVLPFSTPNGHPSTQNTGSRSLSSPMASSAWINSSPSGLISSSKYPKVYSLLANTKAAGSGDWRRRIVSCGRLFLRGQCVRRVSTSSSSRWRKSGGATSHRSTWLRDYATGKRWQWRLFQNRVHLVSKTVRNVWWRKYK